jgi:putative photosynthetic complex assembly protein
MNTLANNGLPGRHALTGWIFVGFLSSVFLVIALLRGQGMEIPQEHNPVSWQRTLRFEDRPNGDVAVMEGQSNTEITRYSGEQGFVRGILRALARERMRRGIGSGPTFELIGYTDGRQTLLDPATGQRINLESFGPTNMAAFAMLQPTSQPTTQASQE